jgi:hypothetical protein
VPDPNPRYLAVDLSGAADAVELTVYSVALVRVSHLGLGAGHQGWNKLAVDLYGLPNGLYFARVEARRDGASARASAPLKLLIVR